MPAEIDTRVGRYDWAALSAHLVGHGWASLPGPLTAGEAAVIAALYDDDTAFRCLGLTFHDAR